MRHLLLLLAALSAPAMAAERVVLTSDVFVAREVKDASGKVATVLQPPKMVTPGDRLVFVLDYKNVGDAAATNFTVTNPIPSAVLYANDASAGAQVSADGGKIWGALATLSVRGADGKPRAAVASDVTHIRWTLAAPVPAGRGGKLQFAGVVR